MWFYYTMFENGEEWHLRQMPFSKPSQLTVECSPAYFHNSIAMERITTRYQNAFFFVILRDPVERAVSHFLHNLREDPRKVKMNATQMAAKFEKYTLDERGEIYRKWEVIEYGVYSKVLKEWLKIVPKSRMLVLDGSSFSTYPFPELKLLENHLGLPEYFKSDMFVRPEGMQFFCFKSGNRSLSCMGREKGRKHPPIRKVVLDKLAQFYEPYNEELYSIIGRRFKWRKKGNSLN